MDDAPSREELAARLEAVEARTDAKFGQLIGEMRTGFAALNGRIDALSARVDAVERSVSGTKATVVVTGIALFAAVIAVLAYGQTWFGIGVTTRDIVRATIAEYQQQAPPHAK